MSKAGAFTFVLHSHMPYARQAGRWPHGEEWIHEAMVETYIPLLDALYDVHEAGIPAHLTITLTPILLEQLADGGRLVMPVGPTGGAQKLLRIARDGDDFRREMLANVSFVPMLEGKDKGAE